RTLHPRRYTLSLPDALPICTLKGTAQDFIPNRPTFHVLPSDGSPAVPVRHLELKAVFFVRDLEGNPHRIDVPAFTGGPAESAYGDRKSTRLNSSHGSISYAV